MVFLRNLIVVFFLTGCSFLTGPEGIFPEKQYEFLDEEIAEDINLPEDIKLLGVDNHYPVTLEANEELFESIPKPRQIFSAGGASEVQLRRLGELLWVYVETLPSTTWPITRSYWETSDLSLVETNPETGEMIIEYSNDVILVMTVEHGIKESSSEIFLTALDSDTYSSIEFDSQVIQSYLEDIVNYVADSVGTFSGTSLAAQSLNEQKKSRIYSEGNRTVIELDLSFDRAWSTVSRAIEASDIVSTDRNREEGIFYVSLEPQLEESRLNFLNPFNLFRQDNVELKDNNTEPQFQIFVNQSGTKTQIRAQLIEGVETSENAEDLLSKLNESLS